MIRLRTSSRRLTSTALALLAGLATATAASPAADIRAQNHRGGRRYSG